MQCSKLAIVSLSRQSACQPFHIALSRSATAGSIAFAQPPCTIELAAGHQLLILSIRPFRFCSRIKLSNASFAAHLRASPCADLCRSAGGVQKTGIE